MQQIQLPRRLYSVLEIALSELIALPASVVLTASMSLASLTVLMALMALISSFFLHQSLRQHHHLSLADLSDLSRELGHPGCFEKDLMSAKTILYFSVRVFQWSEYKSHW